MINGTQVLADIKTEKESVPSGAGYIKTSSGDYAYAENKGTSVGQAMERNSEAVRRRKEVSEWISEDLSKDYTDEKEYEMAKAYMLSSYDTDPDLYYDMIKEEREEKTQISLERDIPLGIKFHAQKEVLKKIETWNKEHKGNEWGNFNFDGDNPTIYRANKVEEAFSKYVNDLNLSGEAND